MKNSFNKVMAVVISIGLSLSMSGFQVVKADTLPSTTPPSQTELTQLQNMTLAQLQAVAKPMPTAALENDLGTIRMGDWSYFPQDSQVYYLQTKVKNIDEIDYYEFLYVTPLPNDTSKNIEITVYCWDYVNGVYNQKYSGIETSSGKDLTGRFASSGNSSSGSTSQTPSNTPGTGNSNSSTGDGNNSSNSNSTKTYKEKRISGDNSIDTSLAIATEFNNSTVQNVILANAYLFPDALSGSVLTKKYNAPILLVGSVSENTNTLAFIKSHLATDGMIYLLGGTASISDDVVNSIKALGFNNIVRLGGSDRIDTNLAIVNNLNVVQGTPIIIASQINYPDALSISPIASLKGYPILLSDIDTTDQRTLDAISSIKPSTIYIVGGTGVIDSNVENVLKSYAPNVIRLGGIDRYDTSLIINNYFNLSSTTAIIASGNNFQEALSGIALAVKNSSPVILTDTTDVTRQKQYLSTTNISNLYLLGDTTSITTLEETMLAN
jgi:putative cell wall-binding protein